MRPAPTLAILACLLLVSLGLASCQTPGEQPTPEPGSPTAIKQTCGMGLRLLGQTGGWQRIAIYEKMRQTGCFQGPAAKPTPALQRLSAQAQQREYDRLIGVACATTSSDLASGRPSQTLDLEDIYTAFVATNCIGK
jgi:hypothetical protein